MKAYVLHDIGDFRLEEVPNPVINDDEVLVQVMAAGICGSDIPRVYETGAHRHPIIIGHEFSGKVVGCGRLVDEKWKGKSVGIFPLIPCKECHACKKKQYEMCENYSYLGSRCDGGFAEYAAVPEWNLIELPEKVNYFQAAMLEPMAVAVHAIRKAMKDFGQKQTSSTECSIAVCGMGTIGLFLTMFLKGAGYKEVYVIGNKEFQKNKVVQMGVDESRFCDVRTEDVNGWLAAKTAGRGVDIFFECVGKNETVVQAIENAAPSGKVVLVGNPYSDVLLDKNVYWRILRKQITVTGTWNSSFTKDEMDDWHYVLSMLEQGRINPEGIISHKFQFEHALEGFGIMRDKTEEYGKILIRIKNRT